MNYGMKLVATGMCLPAKAVTNDDLSKIVDTSDEWIASRTGIRQRYFCGEGESATTLAVGAARQAMENSGIAPEEIGCLVCGTLSADWATPSMACLVQAALGLPHNIPVLDVNAACTGFLYAASVARGLMLGTDKRYALVVGCEQLSHIMDMTDRNTCVLFGDGAGAAVLEMREELPFAGILGAEGDMAIQAEGPGPVPSHVRMDGKAVFRFAVGAIPRCIEGVLAQTGDTLEDVDWVVCHQANERIIDHVIKKLKADPAKFYKNMDRYGNTSAASVPIALAEMNAAGMFKPGQKVLAVGFGGGLTWAAQMLYI